MILVSDPNVEMKNIFFRNFITASVSVTKSSYKERTNVVLSSCPWLSESSQSRTSRCRRVRWPGSPDNKSLDNGALP